MRRATALLVLLAALAGAGLGVWRPWEAAARKHESAIAALASLRAGSADDVAPSSAVAAPRDVGDRRPVGRSRGDELSLVLRTDAACGQAMDIPVTVVTESTRENRVVHVGEPSSWSVSGVARIEAGGFGWLRVSHVVDLETAPTSEVVLDVQPRAMILGRVVDELEGTPIESFGLRVESTLGKSDQGAHTYVGSRRAFSSPDGSFCLVPLQEASSHRLTFDADGYETHNTEWIPVTPGQPLDLGDVLLAPAPTRPLHVRVLDAASGTPVEDAAVLVATYPLAADELVLAGERIAPAPSLARADSAPQTARTDDEGVATLVMPVGKPLWIAAWRDPYGLGVIGHSSLAEAAQPREAEVELRRGPRIEGLLHLGPDLRALIRRLDIEVRSEGGRRQLPVELVEPLDAIPFEVGGLSPGPAELWVVAREEGSGASLTRALIATQSIVLEEVETLHVEFDCGIDFGEGVVHGSVSVPAGLKLSSLRAFASTDFGSPLPRRTVPVHEGAFVLSGCDAPRTLLGARGFDSSGAIQLMWIGVVDGTSNPVVSIDLASSVVHGHAGELFPLPMEEIVVRPIDDHPLAGVPLATVTAYPGSDGEFTIYGLAPGSYRATGSNSGLGAVFRVVDGSVDVRLTRRAEDDR